MRKIPDEKDPRENLGARSSVQKVQELAKAARICLFGTMSGRTALVVRPMAIQDVDLSGNLWFLSGKSSAKNRQIARNPRVQLLFSNVGDSEYLNIHGVASISTDKDLIKEHWTPLAKTWFHEGPDDPEVTVLKVKMESGYYWDTEHGKAVSMISMALGAITGKTLDDSLEGTLQISSTPKTHRPKAGRK